MRQGMPGEQRWRPLGRSTGIHSIEKIIGGESQVLEELNAGSGTPLKSHPFRSCQFTFFARCAVGPVKAYG